MAFRMVRVDSEQIGHGIHFRWGSIFSGAFIAVGFGLFFLVLGNAVGLNIYNVVDPRVHGALRFWSFIYNAAALVLSYGLGAYFGTRTNEIETTAAGGLHGIASWGLTSAIGSILVLMGSVTGRGILQGIGPDSGNWFVLAVLGVGFLASTACGMGGKKAVRYTRVIEEQQRPRAA